MKPSSDQLKNEPATEADTGSLSALEALRNLKLKGLEKVVGVRVNGDILDLSSQVESNSKPEPIYINSEEGLEILRHSTSHVMAMAVKELFPGVRVTIGPAIKDGFYYDFDYKRPFKEEDLPKIEEKMSEIIKADLPFVRKELTSREAIDFFRNEGEDYKVELINDLGAEKVSLYTQGSFT
ncbi:MAG: threonine--tRNA ligase, partial [Deltaproteobacteria bacterium]|nr:threonine--tRNA ligase [Deltaproteobacteria bacterium]